MITDHLLRNDQPHLVVRCRGKGVSVGPLVLAGQTSCLRCADLARSDADPQWPTALRQLSRLRIVCPPVLLAWAASVAAAQALGYLHGEVPEVAGATLELGWPDFVTRLRRWAVIPTAAAVGSARQNGGHERPAVQPGQRRRTAGRPAGREFAGPLRFRRGARLASLPLGFAGRATLGLGKRLGGSPAEQVSVELQQRAAEQLFRVLGELKGGAMKFGQALSLFESVLPEDVAAPYRAHLSRLQDAAPPMPTSRVHAVLARELGADWRKSFTELRPAFPAAAASIGQVHRAVWHDGRTVAVKVQYPGADEALRSDLRQIGRLSKVVRAAGRRDGRQAAGRRS